MGGWGDACGKSGGPKHSAGTAPKNWRPTCSRNHYFWRIRLDFFLAQNFFNSQPTSNPAICCVGLTVFKAPFNDQWQLLVASSPRTNQILYRPSWHRMVPSWLSPTRALLTKRSSLPRCLLLSWWERSKSRRKSSFHRTDPTTLTSTRSGATHFSLDLATCKSKTMSSSSTPGTMSRLTTPTRSTQNSSTRCSEIRPSRILISVSSHQFPHFPLTMGWNPTRRQVMIYIISIVHLIYNEDTDN